MSVSLSGSFVSRRETSGVCVCVRASAAVSFAMYVTALNNLSDKLAKYKL